MVDTHYLFMKHLMIRYNYLIKEYEDCVVSGSEPMQLMTCACGLVRYMTDSDAVCTEMYLEKEFLNYYLLYRQINGIVFYGIRRDSELCQLITELGGYKNGLTPVEYLNFVYLFDILIVLYFYLFHPKIMFPGIINWHHYNKLML